ncbi:MAG TPA: phosphodiester glycosidase family protein [Rhodanobacteraceae bacterium]|nr:phosphodiester glycosidase family protein [Rhodanobacteraceae bacterium]
MRSHRCLRALAAFFAFTGFDPRGVAALESRTLHAGDADYRVVTLDLAHDALELRWRDADGKPYGSIEALRRADGRTLRFATNAGIYDREFRPLGLTIADGEQLRGLNTTRGRSGNFGIQPNGVFYVDREGHAGVVATGDWRARGIDARLATQSGPMLVIDGALNANFDEGSESRKWRSGVCARTPDSVVFAVSEVPVSFHQFARVFRDEIGCRDALYLDGTLSQIYTAEGGYAGAPSMMVKPYAGMLAVFAGAPAGP